MSPKLFSPLENHRRLAFASAIKGCHQLLRLGSNCTCHSKKCVLLYFKREKNTSDLTTPARNGLLSMVKLEILFQHQLPLNYRHRAKLTKYFSKSKPEPPIRTKECQCLNEHSISGHGRIKGRDIPDYVPDFLCGALVALVRWAPFLKET